MLSQGRFIIGINFIPFSFFLFFKGSYKKFNLIYESHLLACIMFVLECNLTLTLGPAWFKKNLES